MSEQMKAAIRKVADEAWNKGNLSVLDEVYAPNVVRHRSPLPDITGIDALKANFVRMRESYPDLRLAVEEIVVEGNTSAFRWTFRARQTTPSPITSEEVKVTGCQVSHWKAGKIVEEWGHNNREYVL